MFNKTLGYHRATFHPPPVAVYPRSLRAQTKKMTSPDRLKIRRNCIKTVDYSISIYVSMLHSNINAFTCSWYVSNTYHSPVNVHVTATYCIRSTPVYWSRLGRNRYRADTYLPSIYSRSEYLFPSRSVATNLVTSLKFQPIRCAVMLCIFGRARNGSVTTHFILFGSTAESRAKSGYIVVPESFGQNYKPASSNKERARKKPSFVPKVNLNDAIVFPRM